MLEIPNIELRVKEMAGALEFYRDRMGFVVVKSSPVETALATAAGEKPILRLLGDLDAPVAPPEAAGMFHAALLLPGRAELGAWLIRAVKKGVQFEGFADHGVSEALYLHDPEGNGLEFYADRPADQWNREGDQVEMYTHPLDFDSLLAAGAAAGTREAPLGGARWGHIHLRVTDLDRSEKFYAEKLGMIVTQRGYAGARFLAADGYHHHVGLNTWTHSRTPQVAGSPGMAAFEFRRGDGKACRKIVDPDQMALVIRGKGE